MSWHPIQSIIENLNGRFNNQTITKEEAKNLVELNRLAVEQMQQTSELQTAKNAANKFKRTPTYAATLIESTLKLLRDSQPEGEEKYPKLKLDEKILSDELALTEKSPLTEAIDAYKSGTAPINNFDTKELDNLKQPLIKAIETQHDQDTSKIKGLFKNPKFTNGQETPSVATVEKRLLAALEQAKKEKIAELERDVQPDPIRRLEYYKKAQAKILFLASIAENARHQSYFDALEQKRQNKGQELSISSGEEDDESGKYADADLEQLKEIYTYSGKHFEVTENQIKLQSSIFGFGVTPEDALQLALYGKAKGWNKIVLSVEHTDPQKLSIMEQNAARAALKAGFDPEKITIKTKDREGKEITKTVQQILGGEAVESLLNSTNTSATQEYKANVQVARENSTKNTLGEVKEPETAPNVNPQK